MVIGRKNTKINLKYINLFTIYKHYLQYNLRKIKFSIFAKLILSVTTSWKNTH